MSLSSRIRTACAVVFLSGLGVSAATAADGVIPARLDVRFGESAPPAALGGERAWRVDFGATGIAPDGTLPTSAAFDLAATAAAVDAQEPVRRPVAYVYSDGYTIRAKVHKYASYITLPIFASQYLLGQKLDGGRAPESVRWTHAAIATTMVGLFGVNTVTGVWNALEGRKNPNGFRRRLIHSLLMLSSDAGFVATGLLAPTNDGGGNRDAHKTVAITSIGVATAGYLLMFFGQ